MPEKLRDQLKYFNHTLVNRYKRKYFTTSDNRFRVTVDSDGEYFSKNSILEPYMYKKVKVRCVIVELKLNSSVTTNGSEISKTFPFRMTKSSKYVLGLNKLMMGRMPY